MMKQAILNKFAELFGTEGIFYFAPGRINLIGEHTDYNGGFVFPGAIDRGIMLEISLNGTDRVRVFSLDYDQYLEFGLDESDKPDCRWASYIFGVCRETLKLGGSVAGFDAVFAGDVPLGAGLSSSAALESVFAYAINELNDNGFSLQTLARIGQSTEFNYCGVKCGIMDQFASCHGKAGCLILLDCRSMEYRYYPFDPGKDGYELVLIDTCVKHELASSAYNKRRESCEKVAAAICNNGHPEVRDLRDANRWWLEEVRDVISEEDMMRGEYVIGELQRVLDVCDALERKDYETVGEMMYQTHFGMSRLYEVSCEELDFLNRLARRMGVTGSRVMGGGFGGCTLNLVRKELRDSFVSEACKEFAEAFGHEPKVYPVAISDGVRRL